MSVYVLRSVNLVKIGYSDFIAARVQAIISASPVPVEFVGYMPGGRDVEHHLHERFAACRFSGEWFVETPEMSTAFLAILTPGLPARETKKTKKRQTERGYQDEISRRLKLAVKSRWPELNARDRLKAFAMSIGWTGSRAKDIYYSHSKMTIRALEIQELEAWISSASNLATA